MAAVDFLSMHEMVDPQRIGIIGICGEGVIAHEAPDADAVLACNELGKSLARL